MWGLYQRSIFGKLKKHVYNSFELYLIVTNVYSAPNFIFLQFDTKLVKLWARTKKGICSSYHYNFDPDLWPDRAGVNQWRDCIKPRQILENYCKQNHVSGPHFYGNNSVKVGKKIHNLADYGEYRFMKDIIKYQCLESY